jgi:hypothetical protein
MIGIYLEVVSQQGDHLVAWFLGGLAAAALLGLYGVARSAPRRGLALAVSGVVLTVLGILGLASIGLPILGAGVLALVAAAGSRQGGRRLNHRLPDSEQPSP